MVAFGFSPERATQPERVLSDIFSPVGCIQFPPQLPIVCTSIFFLRLSGRISVHISLILARHSCFVPVLVELSHRAACKAKCRRIPKGSTAALSFQPVPLA